MKWHRGKTDKGSEVFDLLESDLQYKILKCTCHGVPTGRYIAFIPRDGARPFVLGGFGSSQEAKVACEDHLKEGTRLTPQSAIA